MHNVPTFSAPDDAVRAYMYMCQYTRNLRLLYETPKDILVGFQPDRGEVKRIFSEVARAGGSVLTVIEARNVLAAYGIPTVKSLAAASAEEAVACAEQLGYPVALKLLARSDRHKAEYGGVALNIRSAPEVTKQFALVRKRAQVPCVASRDPRGRRGGVCPLATATRCLSGRIATHVRPYHYVRCGRSGQEGLRRRRARFPPAERDAGARDDPRHEDLPAVRRQEGAGRRRGRTRTDPPEVQLPARRLPGTATSTSAPVYVRPDGLTVLGARITMNPADVHRITMLDLHLIISMYPSRYEWTH